MNSNPALFYGGILVAIVGLVLGAFFLVPNINHVIADSNIALETRYRVFCSRCDWYHRVAGYAAQSYLSVNISW